MLVADIHHVSLNVSDTETALRFYRDVLGMGVLERPDFGFAGAWLDAGNGRQLHLIAASVPPDTGQHIAFCVDDIVAVITELRAAGIDVPDDRSVPGTAIRQTFVSDPDGNRIEFTQPA
ncbi:MAG: VOC family protein [Ilumatobacter sp.]